MIYLTYDEILKFADDEGLSVKEKKLKGSDGRIFDKRIAIRKDIDSTIEKSCVLAEEIGHYMTTSGDIVDINDVDGQKQEYRARLYGYNIKIGLMGIVKAIQSGCHSLHDVAVYLDVTEEYLLDALDCYKSKYGKCTAIDNYIIFFDPTIVVIKRLSGYNF